VSTANLQAIDQIHTLRHLFLTEPHIVGWTDFLLDASEKIYDARNEEDILVLNVKEGAHED
jgi:hypothetical protein